MRCLADLLLLAAPLRAVAQTVEEQSIDQRRVAPRYFSTVDAGREVEAAR